MPMVEETVDRWLGEAKPCSRAKEKEELEASIARLKGAVATLEEDEATHLRASLATKEAALTRITKDSTNLDS